MKNRFLSLLVATMSLAAAPASAQNGAFYGLLGLSNSDSQFQVGPNDPVDGDDNGWSASLGYAFSSYWAVEVGYHDFGEPTGFAGCPPEVLCIAAYAPGATSVTGWSGQLAGALPLGYDLSLIGKAGVIGWETSARNPSLNGDGSDLIYSLGLQWDLNEQLGMQLSYERVDLDITTARVGVLFRF
jgi:hypothetical protein